MEGIGFGYQAPGHWPVPYDPTAASALGQWGDYSEDQQIIGQAARKSEPALIWQQGEAVLAQADTDLHQPVESIQPIRARLQLPVPTSGKTSGNSMFPPLIPDKSICSVAHIHSQNKTAPLNYSHSSNLSL